MIRYISMYDLMAKRYCTDLMPVDDSMAVVLRIAKRFTFSKYCGFVNPKEIECRTLAKWDSEEEGLIVLKKPIDVFTLDRIDEIYADIAKTYKVDNISKVTIPEVKTEVTHGEFVREIEKQKTEEEKNA